MPGQRFGRLPDLLLRRPAERPPHPGPPAAAKPDPRPDPAALAPLADPAVGWEAGDRVLLVGDLLSAPGQPGLALRIHEALAAARPDLGLVVHSLMNHGYTTAQWRDAAGQRQAGELEHQRPPEEAALHRALQLLQALIQAGTLQYLAAKLQGAHQGHTGSVQHG